MKDRKIAPSTREITNPHKEEDLLLGINHRLKMLFSGRGASVDLDYSKSRDGVCESRWTRKDGGFQHDVIIKLGSGKALHQRELWYHKDEVEETIRWGEGESYRPRRLPEAGIVAVITVGPEFLYYHGEERVRYEWRRRLLGPNEFSASVDETHAYGSQYVADRLKKIISRLEKLAKKK